MQAFNTTAQKTPAKQKPFTLVWDARLRGAPSDALAPPFAIDLTANAPWGLRGGLTLTGMRLRAGPVTALGDALQSTGLPYTVAVPRGFIAWRYRRLELIGGTFSIGYALRLVIDTTRTAAANGFSLVSTARTPRQLAQRCRIVPGENCPHYVTPDDAYRENFLGFGIAVSDFPLGTRLRGEAQAFVAWTPRAVYQYQLARCATCDSIPVYVGNNGQRLVTTTLPAMFNELAFGGHFGLRYGERLRFGFTAYGAVPFMFPGLVFRLSSNYPTGGAFGAVGLSFEGRHRLGDLTVELARSLDRDHGGDFAAAARLRWSSTWGELSLGLRYFGKDFDNPYARPTAAADEVEGSRARNELGSRLTLLARKGRTFTLRAVLDGSARTELTHPRGHAQLGLDYAPVPALVLGLWGGGAWRKDTSACTESDTLAGCSYATYHAGLRAEVPAARLGVEATANYHLDDRRTALSALAVWRPSFRALTTRLHVGYHDDDLRSGPRRASAGVTLRYAFGAFLHVSASYELVAWLAGRPFEHRLGMRVGGET